MRIGIYDPYLDDLGGGEKYMLTLAECLSAHHEVSVFWDNQNDLNDLKSRFSLQLTNINLTKNIFTPQTSFFTKLRETQKYDALIILSDGSIPFTAAKKLFLHIQQPLESLPLVSWKEKLKLNRVRAIFYNSQFTKAYNEKSLSGATSTVIYPPVSLQQKTTEKENIILHVGRFRAKNVDTSDFKKQGVMIEAFKEMVDKKMMGGWKFMVAASVKDGDKEKFSALQKSAENYPIEFFLNKTNDKVWQLFNKAKIYWHASGFGENLEKHPAFAEHFGISTVEAMGAGVVPVVINAGGQKEIVTEEQDGLLWNTISELQQKTVRLIDDSTLWSRLSKQAIVRANDFSREKFCSAITQLITS